MCGGESAVLSDNEGTVVVVDDAPVFRQLVATVLGQAGYRVREAGTAEEALGLAAEERPALVLLDVVLPGLSGYELCRRLREQFGSALPIIFVSGAHTTRWTPSPACCSAPTTTS